MRSYSKGAVEGATEVPRAPGRRPNPRLSVSVRCGDDLVHGVRHPALHTDHRVVHRIHGVLRGQGPAVLRGQGHAPGRVQRYLASHGAWSMQRRLLRVGSRVGNKTALDY